MSNPVPRFQAHLETAHQCWKELIQPGDRIIDATAGNGHDTLVLAKLALTPTSGKIYACDIQQAAITKAQERLQANLSRELYSRIEWVHGSHATFPSEISPQSIKLIVYNLGYLPGGDKSITTFTQTTLQSIEIAQKLIMKGGLICITCYPGHEEGASEEHALLSYAKSLNSKEWSCCHLQWLNRTKAPSLLLLGGFAP